MSAKLPSQRRISPHEGQEEGSIGPASAAASFGWRNGCASPGEGVDSCRQRSQIGNPGLSWRRLFDPGSSWGSARRMFILRKYSVRAQYIGVINDPVFLGVVAPGAPFRGGGNDPPRSTLRWHWRFRGRLVRGPKCVGASSKTASGKRCRRVFLVEGDRAATGASDRASAQNGRLDSCWSGVTSAS